MLKIYVHSRNALARLGDRIVGEETGLSALEYGVFAAFLVLALVGVATFAGPQLQTWMMETMCGIMGKSYTVGAAQCT